MPMGILIVDKPAGWTSHDVVGKLRRLLGERRIGHGGTLDPMATGVLPVFVGRATRAVDYAVEGKKEYIALLRLGITTDTQDVTGRVLMERPVDVDLNKLEDVLLQFRGEIEQIPPMYSAIKRGGRKLYELARRGEVVERPPRSIVIHELEVQKQENPETYQLRVVCSKGTYIRTLCHDIGEALGCGGTMAQLRRTRVGSFDIGRAHTIQELEQDAQQGCADRRLIPVDTCFSDLPEVSLSPREEKKCRNGMTYLAEEDVTGLCRVYSASDRTFLALGRSENGQITTIRSFWSVCSQ